jgi:hypothetical protein
MKKEMKKRNNKIYVKHNVHKLSKRKRVIKEKKKRRKRLKQIKEYRQNWTVKNTLDNKDYTKQQKENETQLNNNLNETILYQSDSCQTDLEYSLNSTFESDRGYQTSTPVARNYYNNNIKVQEVNNMNPNDEENEEEEFQVVEVRVINDVDSSSDSDSSKSPVYFRDSKRRKTVSESQLKAEAPKPEGEGSQQPNRNRNEYSKKNNNRQSKKARSTYTTYNKKATTNAIAKANKSNADESKIIKNLNTSTHALNVNINKLNTITTSTHVKEDEANNASNSIISSDSEIEDFNVNAYRKEKLKLTKNKSLIILSDDENEKTNVNNERAKYDKNMFEVEKCDLLIDNEIKKLMGEIESSEREKNMIKTFFDNDDKLFLTPKNLYNKILDKTNKTTKNSKPSNQIEENNLIKQLGAGSNNTSTTSRKRPRIDSKLNLSEAKQLLSQKNSAVVTIVNQIDNYDQKKMQKEEELAKAKTEIAELMKRIKVMAGKDYEKVIKASINEVNNEASNDNKNDTWAETSGLDQTNPRDLNKLKSQQNNERLTRTPEQVKHSTPQAKANETPYSTPLLTPNNPTQGMRQGNDSTMAHIANMNTPILTGRTESQMDALLYDARYTYQPHMLRPIYAHPMHSYNNFYGHGSQYLGNSFMFGTHKGLTSLTTDISDISTSSVEIKKSDDDDMIEGTGGANHLYKSNNEISKNLSNISTINHMNPLAQDALQTLNHNNNHFQSINTQNLNSHMPTSLFNNFQVNTFNNPQQYQNQPNLTQNTLNPPLPPTHHNDTPKTPQNHKSNSNNPPPINTLLSSTTINKNPIENVQQLTTGGTAAQDANILKFKATLFFSRDLERPKWDSKSNIMEQLTKNFSKTKKMFAGPITVFLKNGREIVIKGERESDYLLFENSKSAWSRNIFDKTGIEACDIEKMLDNNPENMLIGISHDRLSPEGEKWIKKETRINKLRFRGGNRWDLRFEDTKSKNEAMKMGYVQGGGVIFKLMEWTKQISTSQCDKCCKWGHYGKECAGKKMICKYCAAVDTHSSDNCQYINLPDEHKCANCKEIGHHASEKFECLSFLNYYLNICSKENVPIEDKFLKAKEKLESQKRNTRGVASGSEIKAKFDEQLDIMNNKLADQLTLNREVLANDDIDVADYTKYCEDFIDSDIVKIYRKNKLERIKNRKN